MSFPETSLEHFISDPITVTFASPPQFAKSPPCPDGFTWQDRYYIITECIREWHDFARKGKMARNMQPQHAEAASQHGSWGVGRFFFEVKTNTGQYFRIYYDRAPKDALDREGHWVLLAEISIKQA
jgi:hypothetical protein